MTLNNSRPPNHLDHSQLLDSQWQTINVVGVDNATSSSVANTAELPHFESPELCSSSSDSTTINVTGPCQWTAPEIIDSPEDDNEQFDLKVLSDSIAQDDSGFHYIPDLQRIYSTLRPSRIQQFTDHIYDGLVPSRFTHVVTSEILTQIWSQTHTIPSQLLAQDVSNVSPHPFATTFSSNISQGNIGSIPVALKTFRRTQAPVSESKIKRFFFEAVLWSSITHPNFISFRGIHFGLSDNLYMVSTLMNHGTLPKYLESHPEADKLCILTTLAGVIVYLHNRPHPVIHGDIRGMNILVNDDGEPLLTDVGYSMLLDPVTSQPIPSENVSAGCVRWTAGEKIRPCEFPVTEKSDVYAFACLCVEVFSGKMPFDHLKNDGAVVVEVLVRQRHPNRPVGSDARQLTNSLWELLLRCWARDPEARPSMNDIHAFLVATSASMSLLS